MKVWLLERHENDARRAFALRERPDPIPGPGQVLIQSEGFGLNYADVMARRGLYRDAPPPPCVIGYETVGRVTGVGPDTPTAMIGQRVVAITRFGGYAEQVATDHRACAVIPDDMGLGEALALATQGCTAWYMATMAFPLREGQRVLVHSAAGGVGQILVSIAAHRGCEVFAIASGKEKMDFLRGLGAQHAIDRSRGDHAEQVRALLKTGRIDVSFNAVGGTSFKKDMRLLGECGTLVMYGGAERGAGFFGALHFVWSMGLVIPIFLMMRSQSLIGVNMLRIGERHPLLLAWCIDELTAAAREGWLKPYVQRVFPSDGLPEAHVLLASGRSIGKVAVRW